MRRAAVHFAFAVLFAVTAAAQQNENNARGFQPEKSYQVGDIDHVNLFNGNLVATLPIGPEYRLSESLAWRLQLVYNGNPWNYLIRDHNSEAIPSRFANAGLGWQLTMGELVGPNDSQALALQPKNSETHWVLATPDGGERVFHATLHEEEVGTIYAAPAEPGSGDVVGYTRDGTYLRLIRIGQRIVRTERSGEPGNPSFTYVVVAEYRVDFPDGTQQTFTSEEIETDSPPLPTDYEKGARYRLTKIADRFANEVRIVYSLDQTGKGTWTINEVLAGGTASIRTHTVTLDGKTFLEYTGGSQSRGLVSKVQLAAFGGKTLEYTFSYTPYQEISRPCADGTSISNPQIKTILLTGVSAWDGPMTTDKTPLLSYAFDHTALVKNSTGTTVCKFEAGHLKKLSLPTGGAIEYEAGVRRFPALKDGEDVGKGSPPPPPSISAAVSKRRTIDRDGTIAEWTYAAYNMNRGWYKTSNGEATMPRELAVVVTDPLGHVTANYFNTYRIGADDACLSGGTTTDYGLPFTRRTGTSVGGLFLSTEVFAACATWDGSEDGCSSLSPCRDAAGNAVEPLRRTYVQYETDTWKAADLDPESKNRDHNSRLKVSRTTFNDDVGCGGVCYVQSESSSFDGLGHYRVETRSSNMPGTPSRVTTTRYNANPNLGTYARNANSVPSTYMVAPSAPWILAVHDRVTTTEGTQTTTRETCFDTATGFLRRVRTWAGTSAGTSDLLSVFTPSTTRPGNVGREESFGGDLKLIAEGFVTCTGAPANIGYALAHTYSNGVRATTEYDNAGFKSLDLTVDASGLPSASRDTAEVATAYKYDTLGRLTEERPTGSAWTEYTYAQSGTNPASVRVRTWPEGAAATGTPINERWFHFDGLGRVGWTTTKMPDGWSAVVTKYDALGRKMSLSLPQLYASETAHLTATPLHATTYTYDAFGRILSVTAADGSVTSSSYVGARRMTRSSSVATSVGAQSNVSVVEEYDGFGRLRSVRENSGPGAATVTTSYTYDVGDRLTNVSTSGATHTQPRTFEHDGRGLLKKETHPESGEITYTYDARGHVRTRVGGGRTVKFDYDAVERLTDVFETVAGADRRLEHYEFGSANTADDLAKGKVRTATRVNVVPNGGTVEVRETSVYAPPSGLMSERTTRVDQVSADGTRATLQEFTYKIGYDDLRLPKTVTMPTCSFHGCSTSNGLASVTNARTNGVLTSVQNFATLAYHPSGMVSRVTHASAPSAADTYEATNGMARPSRITFAGGTCPAPSASPITAPASVCANSTGNEASVPSRPGVSHTWSISAGGTITSANVGETIKFTAPSSGTVTLTVVAKDACGAMMSSQKTIEVTAAPQVPVISAPAQVSPGSTNNQASVTAPPNATLKWTIAGGGSIVGSDTGTSVTFTAPSSGTVTLTVTAKTDCGESRASVSIPVVPLPPATVTATTQSNRIVAVSWSAVSGASAYRIERTARVGDPATWSATVTGTSYTDTAPASATPVTYIYYVRTIDAASAVSERGAWDHATAATVLYSQPQLVPGVTTIRGADIAELRAAIDALRYAVIVPPAFGGAASPVGQAIRASDFSELVTALSQARWAMGLGSFEYVGVNAPAPGGIAIPAHIEQIREALR